MEFLKLDVKGILEVSLLKGVFGQPVIVHDLNISMNIGISITHTNETIGVLLFDQLHPMGIDIETKTVHDSKFIKPYFTRHENNIIDKSRGLLTYEILFSAKESLSKILKTGLTSPLQIFEISKYCEVNKAIHFFYRNFTQYKSIVVIKNNEIRSITLPVESENIYNLLEEKYNET